MSFFSVAGVSDSIEDGIIPVDNIHAPRMRGVTVLMARNFGVHIEMCPWRFALWESTVA